MKSRRRIDAYVAFVTGLGADYSLDPHVDRARTAIEPRSFRVEDAEYLRARRHPLLGGAPEKRATALVDTSAVRSAATSTSRRMAKCARAQLPYRPATRSRACASRGRTAECAGLRKLTWGDLHGCRDCDLRPYCHRCFANAQMEQGDMLSDRAQARAASEARVRAVHGVPPTGVGAEVRPSGGSLRAFRRIEDVITPTMLTSRERMDGCAVVEAPRQTSATRGRVSSSRSAAPVAAARTSEFGPLMTRRLMDSVSTARLP
jgi:hypothetical protein